jgi:hypothetical protein
VAYLIGLILGDGHIKMVAKRSSRISIAFNSHDETALEIAKSILSQLQIDFFVEPKIRHNCLMLGFMLPNTLLRKHRMSFSGNKYKAQPRPVESVISNIHFATGLLNSDGCRYKQKNKSKKRRPTTKDRFTLAFCNTVDSIIVAMKNCLTRNSVPFGYHEHTHKNPKWKKYMLIYIGRKQWVDYLCAQKFSKWSTGFSTTSQEGRK